MRQNVTTQQFCGPPGLESETPDPDNPIFQMKRFNCSDQNADFYSEAPLYVPLCAFQPGPDVYSTVKCTVQAKQLTVRIYCPARQICK